MFDSHVTIAGVTFQFSFISEDGINAFTNFSDQTADKRVSHHEVTSALWHAGGPVVGKGLHPLAFDRIKKSKPAGFLILNNVRAAVDAVFRRQHRAARSVEWIRESHAAFSVEVREPSGGSAFLMF